MIKLTQRHRGREAQRGIFLNFLLASEPPNLHAAKATFLVEPSVKEKQLV